MLLDSTAWFKALFNSSIFNEIKYETIIILNRSILVSKIVKIWVVMIYVALEIKWQIEIVIIVIHICRNRF